MKNARTFLILVAIILAATLFLIIRSRSNDTETTGDADNASITESAPANPAADDLASSVPETNNPEPFAVDADSFTTADSGLKLYDIAEGNGESPQNGDILSVNYSMWLADDLTFIDSTDGFPIEFIMGAEQVFPGWEEGMIGMKPGGIRQLNLPPELGLGEAGGGPIPPNSSLIIEVELVEFRTPLAPSEVDESAFTATESGLQIADINVGTGETPADGDMVSVDYGIWLAEDGRFVASSIDQGAPFDFVFGSNQVFPGWNEGMTSMAVGGLRQIIIPAELALGEAGVPGLVPPNAVIIMEIELLSVQPQAKPTAVDEADFTVTDTGLKIYDLAVGEGDVAEAGQTLTVHYTGWLESGLIFDSSVTRGQPFDFVLGQGMVIAGWDEGMAGMRVGGKRQLVIPAELGYGAQGAGDIPPGATLIFEVELLGIQGDE